MSVFKPLFVSPAIRMSSYKVLVCMVAFAASLASEAKEFHFQKNAEGMILPFKMKNVPLLDVIEGMENLTGISIHPGAPSQYENEKASLFILKPLSEEILKEHFHSILRDRGLAVVEGPEEKNWILYKLKDARDLDLPIYDSKDVPNSYRLVTVFHTLQFVDAANMARLARSFMPANSRIIPFSKSKLAITDFGRNIRKVVALIRILDTEAAGKKKIPPRPWREPRSLDEKMEPKQIANITVEKLEIQQLSSLSKDGLTRTSDPTPVRGGK